MPKPHPLGLTIRMSRPGSSAELRLRTAKIVEVLQLLRDRHEDSFSLYLSGNALQELKNTAGVIPLIQSLIKSGRVEPLSGIYFEPPPWIDLANAAYQLKTALTTWSDLGAHTCPGIYFTKQLYQARLLSLLREFPVKFLVYESKDAAEAQSTVAVSGLAVAGAVIPALRQPPTPNETEPFTIFNDEELDQAIHFIERIRKLGAICALGASLAQAASYPKANLPTYNSEAFDREDAVTRLFYSRSSELDADIHSAASGDSDALIAPKSTENFLLAKLQSMNAATSANFDSGADQFVWKRFYEALLAAQVYLDQGNNPTVDPNEGWVRLTDRQGAVVDTQLMRAYFNPSGELYELDYKPRRINLAFPTRLGSSNSSTLQSSRAYLLPDRNSSQGAVSAEPEAPFRVFKSTKDLNSFRYHKPLSHPAATNQRCVLAEEVSFRAGIGAHLSNSTTGFSIEYWIEFSSAPLDQQQVVLEWDLLLTSAAVDVCNAQILLCVGGVSPTRLPLDTPQRITSEEVPGGIYGARLIDSIDDLTIDFRFSKPLSDLRFDPLKYETDSSVSRPISGFRMSCVLPARQISGDNKTYTLFVSIL